MRNGDLSKAIKSFFEHHMVSQRGLSGHTILAYRDSWKLLLEFACRRQGKRSCELTLDDLKSQLVRSFLDHLESTRKNSIHTRNNRLAAIHSFFRYLSTTEPRRLAQCESVLAVPFKRHPKCIPTYLDREEVLKVFEEIDPKTQLGQRDDAILRLLYNTGMRAHELVNLNLRNLSFSRPYYIRILGKGNKERTCPLWPETVKSIKRYLANRSESSDDSVPLFLNNEGNRLSRFGLRYIVAHRVGEAAKICPSLLNRKISPHTWRHTTAMHLLQSNVDLNMIKSWLGHASIETTHGYVEIDLEMKRKTLESCEKLLPGSKSGKALWQRDRDVLSWLSKL
jgi:integrase/recombinase XerC